MEPPLTMYMARKIDYYSDDHQKALEIGYRALRDGYDDPEIHASYMIGLIMTGRSGRDANFERSQVAEDTVIVFARAQGDPVTRIIETAPTPRIDREEISPQDSLAQRLMGLAVTTSAGTYTTLRDSILDGFCCKLHRPISCA